MISGKTAREISWLQRDNRGEQRKEEKANGATEMEGDYNTDSSL